MKRTNRRNWHIAIAVSRFNTNITRNLLKWCRHTLVKAGVPSRNIQTVWVPGAFELPFLAHKLALSQKYDAVICLGCIIKGETSHDLHIAQWAAGGIGQAGLASGVPTLFGVLTPHNEQQARERSRPGPLNRGMEVAEAAIEMIELNQKGF